MEEEEEEEEGGARNAKTMPRRGDAVCREDLVMASPGSREEVASVMVVFDDEADSDDDDDDDREEEGGDGDGGGDNSRCRGGGSGAGRGGVGLGGGQGSAAAAAAVARRIEELRREKEAFRKEVVARTTPGRSRV